MLIKGGDSGDIRDIFSLEEIKDGVKEKGYITIKEIGDRYRNKTNNINISNKSIGKYLKSLGLYSSKINRDIRGFSSSNFLSILEKNVSNVSDVSPHINSQRLRILNEWKEFAKRV
ncbi:MAG TPA: hypothetical protein VLS45_05040 [Methylomicrobium sp.]|nr:hypothetical protein [Methylomicrobium sp.]